MYENSHCTHYMYNTKVYNIATLTRGRTWVSLSLSNTCTTSFSCTWPTSNLASSSAGFTPAGSWTSAAAIPSPFSSWALTTSKTPGSHVEKMTNRRTWKIACRWPGLISLSCLRLSLRGFITFKGRTDLRNHERRGFDRLFLAAILQFPELVQQLSWRLHSKPAEMQYFITTRDIHRRRCTCLYWLNNTVSRIIQSVGGAQFNENKSWPPPLVCARFRSL